MKTIGILAGLGPLAGAFFYERLIQLTPAKEDQEHFRTLLISDPAVPNRVNHLLGNGPSPVYELQRLARLLQNWGADFIVIPSSTTHAYYEEIQQSVKIPVLHLLKIVSEAIEQKGCLKPAFIATTATAELQLYHPFLAAGCEPIYPDKQTQKELQRLINRVKQGESQKLLRTEMDGLLKREWCQNADGFVFACTETPLIQPKMSAEAPIFSAVDLLAQAAIRFACEPEGLQNLTSKIDR